MQKMSVYIIKIVFWGWILVIHCLRGSCTIPCPRLLLLLWGIWSLSGCQGKFKELNLHLEMIPGNVYLVFLFLLEAISVVCVFSGNCEPHEV